MIDFEAKRISVALRRLTKAMQDATAARGGSHPCPNCGQNSNFVGICHDCFSTFEKTEGGWPAWEAAKQRWRRDFGG